LLVQMEGDPERVQNSLFYYLALVDVKVPAEMHLFAAGGTATDCGTLAHPLTSGPRLAERRLKTIGVVRQ
jgi:hypothetical protein